jgi:hypothetical protein
MKVGDLVRTTSASFPYYGIIVKYRKRHDKIASVKIFFPYKFNKIFDFCIDTNDVEVVDEV